MDTSSRLLKLAKEQAIEILNNLSSKDKNKISIVVVGSAAIGLADKYSDLDGKIICWEKIRLKKQSKIIDGHKIDFEITTIDEFCINPLILRNDWNVSPFGLFAVSNAVILYDPKKRFEKIQKKVGGYYQKKVWKKLVLATWRSLLEDGRYNLTRDIKRNKEFMSNLHTGNALWHSMMLCFYLNESYYPTHHQWLYDRFLKLPKLSKEINFHINRILKTTNMRRKNDAVTKIIGIYSKYLQKHRIIDERYLEKWWLIPWR